eukprot:TRINITY_DN13299_c0_g1_i1.p1 TRINITY_DN13299_c0_g1~~TRINITY_DN13299_c0_g1_i1.p1  ORF type:complete len:187 (-),score=32.86 TRINITY_DN13299_c0_g1_i1:22-582(-)
MANHALFWVGDEFALLLASIVRVVQLIYDGISWGCPSLLEDDDGRLAAFKFVDQAATDEPHQQVQREPQDEQEMQNGLQPILKVFLLGESGAGKTTLRKAMLKFVVGGLGSPPSWLQSAADKPRDASGRTCGAELKNYGSAQDRFYCAFRALNTCLLYTSDAADEEDSVDLGGCRIIKKKNTIKLV